MATGSAAQAAQSVALRLRAEPGSQQQGLTWARSDHWPSAISPSPPLAALGLGSVCGFSCSMHGHRRHTCGRGPGFLPERAAGRASLRGPKVGERKRQDRKAGQGAAPRGKPATQTRQGRRLTGPPGPRATDPKLRTRGTPGVQMPHARDVSLLGGVQGQGDRGTAVQTPGRPIAAWTSSTVPPRAWAGEGLLLARTGAGLRSPSGERPTQD